MSMSLTSNSSSQASSKTDEQDSPEPDIPEPDMARHLGFTQSDAHFASSQKAGTSDVRPRRAASFTDGTRSSALSHKFQEIRRRATDLSALRDTFGDADFTPTPTERKTFDLSPTSALVPFKLPFLISGSHEGSRRTGKIPPSSLRRSPGQKPEGRAPPELKSSASDDASCQAGLTQSMELARELLAMAAARQGPILLLSTDLVRLKLCVEAGGYATTMCEFTLPTPLHTCRATLEWQAECTGAASSWCCVPRPSPSWSRVSDSMRLNWPPGTWSLRKATQQVRAGLETRPFASSSTLLSPDTTAWAELFIA